MKKKLTEVMSYEVVHDTTYYLFFFKQSTLVKKNGKKTHKSCCPMRDNIIVDIICSVG